jgi:VWFA-related protein
MCACALSAAAGQSKPELHILSPADAGYVSGPTLLRAGVWPPSAAVERITLYADGQIVCVLEQPPFECTWDAGPGVIRHQVRAVAILRGGETLRRVIHTRELELSETVSVDMVQITATVNDRRGRLVPNLTRESFRVFEDGVPQAITSFLSENIPLEIVIAVDVSGSMSEAMAESKAGVKSFLSALRPQDRITLLAFNDNVFTLARPTSDPAARIAALDRLSAWGGTAFYEAVVRAMASHSRESGRRALVMFTDGEDRHSLVTLADAERRLETSDCVLYLIGLGQAVKDQKLKAVIESLSEKSGGRPFFAEKARDLEGAFKQIVQELSRQYLLGYSPTNSKKDGAWRAIRVETNDSNLRVRARQGYRAVAAAPAR